jgi:hypothetical protein
MMARRVLLIVGLGLLGVLAAASIGYASYLVSRDDVGLPVTKLEKAPRDVVPVQARTSTTGTTSTRTATVEDRTTRSGTNPSTTGDDNSGRGRGGDDNSGKGSSGSGSGSSGKGSGGGDDFDDD